MSQRRGAAAEVRPSRHRREVLQCFAMLPNARRPSRESLEEEIVSLAPWHIDVEVVPGLSTAVSLDVPAENCPPEVGKPGFYSPRSSAVATLARIFPNGLEGRSVIDCACNCGAYLFWAKEQGAGDCFGFDISEHWIRQARFLAENRDPPSEPPRFEVRDLYDLPALGLQPHDLTFFRGIFYHLPDPIHGLRIAADLTRELIIVNSATWNGLPDGMLVLGREGRAGPLPGVHGLKWFPTGPETITRTLEWLGFPETRCHMWHREMPNQPPELGRVEILAARDPEILNAYDTRTD